MHQQRKSEHLRICLDEDPESSELTTGLEQYRFFHQALPEIDLDDVDTSCTLLGKSLDAPLIISSMTGGTAEAEQINLSLAEAAQESGVAMGVGSLRAALEEPSVARTYQVRAVAPHILLLANLGAVQLNCGYGVDDCQRAVEMIEADGLILHLNPLQECLQRGGDTNFGALVARIEKVCRQLEAPVVVKEVGWGISSRVAAMLRDAGVAAIDVAGAGGTSWSAVEGHRAPDEQIGHIAQAFAEWGIPTAESIVMARQAAPETTIIGSGGIRTGIDVAKAIALGAHAAGLGTPFLRPASLSAAAVVTKLQEVVEELRISMFCTGAQTLGALRDTPLLQRIDRC
jgi:isopentenyl-diphosphate delta-isomerase